MLTRYFLNSESMFAWLRVGSFETRPSLNRRRCRIIKISMKYAPLAILTFISLFLAAGELDAQSNTPLEDTENVLVYPSIPVIVNKSVVVRLSGKASKVFVTQPQIAEIVVVAPDQLLINGKAVGATSLVVWFEENTKARKQ